MQYLIKFRNLSFQTLTDVSYIRSTCNLQPVKLHSMEKHIGSLAVLQDGCIYRVEGIHVDSWTGGLPELCGYQVDSADDEEGCEACECLDWADVLYVVASGVQETRFWQWVQSVWRQTDLALTLCNEE